MAYFVTVREGSWSENSETIVRRVEINGYELSMTVSDVIEIGQHEERVNQILRKMRQALPHLKDKAYLYRWFPDLAPLPLPEPAKPEPFNGDYLWTEVD